jgi:hypothetical protein
VREGKVPYVAGIDFDFDFDFDFDPDPDPDFDFDFDFDNDLTDRPPSVLLLAASSCT